MTTDPFIEAAREEARRYHWEQRERGVPYYPALDFGQHMAEWARAHLAAQEPTDAERAVRELHRPVPVYALSEECTAREIHEWSEASHGGEEICLNEPTGEEFCAECCPEDAFDCTDYPYPCATIQALDAARAARRDEETTR